MIRMSLFNSNSASGNTSSNNNNMNNDHENPGQIAVLHHKPGILHSTNEVGADRNNNIKCTMGIKVISLLSLAIAGFALITWGTSTPSSTTLNKDNSIISSVHRLMRNKNNVVHVQLDHERNHHFKESQQGDSSAFNIHKDLNVWVTGLVKDAAMITDDTFNFLMEWHCEMGANIHFMVEEGAMALLKRRANYIHEQNERSSSYSEQCTFATFKVLTQAPDLPSIIPNRIDRIAHLRDIQRAEVRNLSKSNDHADATVDAVIVIDGDLHSVPNARFAFSQMVEMLYSSSIGDENNMDNAAFDVVCATGVNHKSNVFAYYDTFATILLPDTWVYPLHSRLEQDGTVSREDLVRRAAQLHPEEDLSLVIETGITSQELLQYIQTHATAPISTSEASSLSSKVLPVKSCFGGMVFYRGKLWLDTPCTYSGTKTNDMFAHEKGRSYANLDDQRSCEHVTFHQCLTQHQNTQAKLDESKTGSSKAVKIALHPSIVTEWHDVNELYENDQLVHTLAEERKFMRSLGGEDPFPIVPTLITDTPPETYDDENTNLGLSSNFTSTTLVPSSNFTSSNLSPDSNFTSSNLRSNSNLTSDNLVPGSNMTGTILLPTSNITMIPEEEACTCMFHFDITTDFFAYETSFELIHLTDTDSEVILTSEPLEKSTLQGPPDFCLPEGAYIFFIYDSFGDGLFDPAGYNIDVCGGVQRTGSGSNNRWNVERTPFIVTADGTSELPTVPEKYNNGILVARTSSNECAESMGWGPSGEFADKVEGQDGFMCTDCDVDPNGDALLHTQWMQVFYDVDMEIMRILWTFKDAKTLAKRFDQAHVVGEDVTWSIVEATAPETEHTKTGKWYFSTGFSGWPTQMSGNRKFSKDDGAWGAADGDLNADAFNGSSNNINNIPHGFWGQGNFNGGDGLCSTYYRDGKEMKLEKGALWSELYIVTDTIQQALPTPSPTDAPSMAPTPTQDCHFQVMIATDLWGEEVAWSLKRIGDIGVAGVAASDEMVVDVPPNSYGSRRQYMYTNSCLDPGMYEFKVIDTAKDGFFAPAGVDVLVGGEFQISFGGKFSSFTSEDTYIFEIEGTSDGLF